MEHVWSIICHRSSIDVETNLLSIFDCIEELDMIVDNSPAPGQELVVPVAFQIVSLWIKPLGGKGGNLVNRVEFIDPAGRLLNELENIFQIKEGVIRFRSRTNIQGFKVVDSGRYIIRILKKAEGEAEFVKAADLPLDVKVSYKLLDVPGK